MPKSPNNKLFAVGTCESVDLDTGESVPVEGGGFRMLPGPPGSCPMCHTVHDPKQPHDQQSLAYQMKFRTLHGRPPTWSDAMSHCDPVVRAHWRTELVHLMSKNGMKVPEDLREES